MLHAVEAFGGGVFEMVKTLAEYLADEQQAVAIAYGRRSETPADVRGRIAPAVELFPLPWERRLPAEQFAAARHLRQVVSAWNPDVVHLHSSFAGVVGSLALPRSMPLVYTPHGYSFTMRGPGHAKRFVYKMIETITAQRAWMIGAVSETEAGLAQRIAPAEKVLVVRNGIRELDDAPGGPAPHRTGTPLVLAIGRITEARQPAATARILASVADIADVRWVGGTGRGGLPESTVTSSGVPVSGWLERSDVMEQLRAASVYVHWAAWDGQPLSILEAMANDVVVVASDIPPCREILGARQVFDDEAAASGAIRRILSDVRFREELLSSQRERRALFGARRMAHDWRNVYERLAGPSSGTPELLAEIPKEMKT